MTTTTTSVTTTAAMARRPPLWWVLLRHEWRLTVRDFGGGRRGPGTTPRKVGGRKRVLVVYSLMAVLLHGVGVGIASALPRHWSDTQGSRIAVVGVLLFVSTLMLSTAMTRVVRAFHERRDLDLLLCAPIPPTLILLVRALTVVAAVSLVFAIFLYPLADAGVAMGRWWMARLYPLVPLLATFTTGVALVVAGMVVRLVGVRRARVGLQVFSALTGALVYLVSQSRQLLPQGWSARVTRWMLDAARSDDAPLPVTLAARLAAGDGWAWLAFAATSIGVFVLAVRAARRRFVEVAQTPEADARVVRSARSAVERRIATGFARGLFGALLVKEWRLILRAPQLVSQVLLQLLYLMPLLFVAFGRGGVGLNWSASAFAAGIVGITGTLATSLAWLTVAAEDAPDLIASSPKRGALILSSKLTAGALPPIVLVALAALGTAQRSLPDAAIVFGFGMLACISAAILSAASPASGRRSDFQRRHQGAKLSAIVEGFQFIAWAGAAGTAVSGLWWLALGLTAIAAILPGLRLPLALRRLQRIDGG